MNGASPKVLEWGLEEESCLSLKSLSLGVVVQFREKEFLVLGEKGVTRFESTLVKETYPYILTALVNVPKYGILIGVTAVSSEFIILFDSDLKRHLMTGIKTGDSSIFNIIFSEKSNTIITAGEQLISWSFVLIPPKTTIVFTYPTIKIKMKKTILQKINSSIMNPPMFDYSTEELFINDNNGSIQSYSLDGTYNGVAIKSGSLSQTTCGYYEQERMFMTTNTSQGAVLWPRNAEISRRFFIGSSASLAIHFINPEFVAILDAKYSITIIDIKTSHFLTCYHSESRINRMFFFPKPFPRIILCSGSNVVLLRVTLPWRLWNSIIGRQISLFRENKLNEAARIVVVLSNSHVRLLSPKNGSVLTALTLTTLSSPINCFYDRGIPDLAHLKRDQILLPLQDGTMQIYSTGQDPCQMIGSIDSTKITCVSRCKYHDQWCFCCGTSHGYVLFYSYETMKNIGRIHPYPYPVVNIFYDSEGENLIVSYELRSYLVSLLQEKENDDFLNMKCTNICLFFNNVAIFSGEHGIVSSLVINNNTISYHETHSMKFHDDEITGFSLGSEFFVSSSMDKTIKVWAKNFDLIYKIGFPLPIYQCCVLNGKRDILCSTENEIMIIRGTLIFGRIVDPQDDSIDNYDLKRDFLDNSYITIQNDDDEQSEDFLLSRIVDNDEEEEKEEKSKPNKVNLRKKRMLEALKKQISKQNDELILDDFTETNNQTEPQQKPSSTINHDDLLKLLDTQPHKQKPPPKVQTQKTEDKEDDEYEYQYEEEEEERNEGPNHNSQSIENTANQLTDEVKDNKIESNNDKDETNDHKDKTQKEVEKIEIVKKDEESKSVVGNKAEDKQPQKEEEIKLGKKTSSPKPRPRPSRPKAPQQNQQQNQNDELSNKQQNLEELNKLNEKQSNETKPKTEKPKVEKPKQPTAKPEKLEKSKEVKLKETKPVNDNDAEKVEKPKEKVEKKELKVKPETSKNKSKQNEDKSKPKSSPTKEKKNNESKEPKQPKEKELPKKDNQEKPKTKDKTNDTSTKLKEKVHKEDKKLEKSQKDLHNEEKKTHVNSPQVKPSPPKPESNSKNSPHQPSAAKNVNSMMHSPRNKKLTNRSSQTVDTSSLRKINAIHPSVPSDIAFVPQTARATRVRRSPTPPGIPQRTMRKNTLSFKIKKRSRTPDPSRFIVNGSTPPVNLFFDADVIKKMVENGDTRYAPILEMLERQGMKYQPLAFPRRNQPERFQHHLRFPMPTPMRSWGVMITLPPLSISQLKVPDRNKKKLESSSPIILDEQKESSFTISCSSDNNSPLGITGQSNSQKVDKTSESTPKATRSNGRIADSPLISKNQSSDENDEKIDYFEQITKGIDGKLANSTNSSPLYRHFTQESYQSNQIEQENTNEISTKDEIDNSVKETPKNKSDPSQFHVGYFSGSGYTSHRIQTAANNNRSFSESHPLSLLDTRIQIRKPKVPNSSRPKTKYRRNTTEIELQISKEKLTHKIQEKRSQESEQESTDSPQSNNQFTENKTEDTQNANSIKQHTMLLQIPNFHQNTVLTEKEAFVGPIMPIYLRSSKELSYMRHNGSSPFICKQYYMVVDKNGPKTQQPKSKYQYLEKTGGKALIDKFAHSPPRQVIKPISNQLKSSPSKT